MVVLSIGVVRGATVVVVVVVAMVSSYQLSGGGMIQLICYTVIVLAEC